MARYGERVPTIAAVLRRLQGSPWPGYAASMVLANLSGALILFVFVRYVLPLPATDLQYARALNLVLFGGYLGLSVVVGFLLGLRILRPVLAWRRRGGPPTAVEQRAVLRAPFRQAIVHAVMWTVGGVLFVSLNVAASHRLAVVIAFSVVLGAAATCSVGYLLAERCLRPVAADALKANMPDKTNSPGVATRVLLTWWLTSALPTSGILVICAAQLAGSFQADARSIAWSVVFVGSLSFLVGLLGASLAANSIADPIKQVRSALGEVQRGRTDVSVQVYDSSEVGLLQEGFNRMAAGVAERERLRDLFGRHVGEDVARLALERGTDLGGEVREVAVFFIDMVGSTHLAASRPPAEVVRLLNEFFRVVVDVVSEHGGLVNKFEGDAALVVFGAPIEHPDAPSAALAAARQLHDELGTMPGVDMGIGVSAGSAVAGNIGAAQRFEYTVIGDPVNEAARLTELAKYRSSRLLAAESAVLCAEPAERARWVVQEEVTLRGRLKPTRLAVPVPVHAPAPP